MNKVPYLYHIRCDLRALHEAQRHPKIVFDRCLKTYEVDPEGMAHRDGLPTLRVDTDRKAVVFPEGGTLPLNDPHDSCGLYTTSPEMAQLFYRALVTGFREGFHACHTEVMHRVGGMSPADLPNEPKTTK